MTDITRVREVPGEDRRAVDETSRVLAQLGGTATAARRAIVRSLLEADRLQSPETLLHAARTYAPRTSLATVYRTLDRLDSIGAMKRATLASGEVAYAYCASGHHEHAICIRCGRLHPIRACLISEEPLVDGFAVSSHRLDFYGVCAECAARDGTGRAAPGLPGGPREDR